MEITRYVSEEMIRNLIKHDLTLADFIRLSDNKAAGIKLDACWHDTPIKIIIPDIGKECKKV